jgi:hypothetical protein
LVVQLQCSSTFFVYLKKFIWQHLSKTDNICFIVLMVINIKGNKLCTTSNKNPFLNQQGVMTRCILMFVLLFNNDTHLMKVQLSYLVLTSVKSFVTSSSVFCVHVWLLPVSVLSPFNSWCLGSLHLVQNSDLFLWCVMYNSLK